MTQAPAADLAVKVLGQQLPVVDKHAAPGGSLTVRVVCFPERRPSGLVCVRADWTR